MKIDKTFSQRLLKSVLKRSRGISDHNLAHPEREWLIGLTIALLILITGIAWSVKLYLTFADIKPVSIEPTNASEQIYRSGDVTRSLEALDERKRTNESLREQLQLKSQVPSFILLEETNDTTDTAPEETTSEDEGTPVQPEEDPQETSPTIPNVL